MPYFALTEKEVQIFSELPEYFNNIQYANVRIEGIQYLAKVIGGRIIAVDPLGGGDDPEQEKFFQLDWYHKNITILERERRFDAWINKKIAERNDLKEFKIDTDSIAKKVYSPNPSTASMPLAPSVIYGHLPFSSVTEADDVFYHFIPFPKLSPRIIPPNTNRALAPQKWKIKSGTYANPPSELPMLPSGFAVTGRNALPGLLPACFRFELQPEPNASIHCGAGVPLFGHSGGGVEVMFVNDTDNRCEIADAVFIPPL